MPVTLTKFFHFSASHESAGRIHGHNYTLGVTIDAAGPAAEAALIGAVESSLILKLQSRDLGTDVDFLKGKTIEDATLLEVFWSILEMAGVGRLREMTLSRDARTLTSYQP